MSPATAAALSIYAGIIAAFVAIGPEPLRKSWGLVLWVGMEDRP